MSTNTKIHIYSNTNGISLEMGGAKAFLFTTEAAVLIEALQQAMARCGEWDILIRELNTIQPPVKVTGDR